MPLERKNGKHTAIARHIATAVKKPYNFIVLLEIRPVINWRGLRHALGLSQAKWAEILCLSPDYLGRLEQSVNRNVHRSTITILRIALRDPELQGRLKAAGFPHPFPEDIL